MSRANIDKILNQEENKEESQIEPKKYNTEFDKRVENLEIDVEHIDNRLGLIQSYITGIDTQLSNLKNLIKNCQNPNEKGKLYNLLNQALELNVKYQDLYLKALDIKRNYRKEQDEFSYKKIRFIEIEIKKAEGDEDERGLTPTKLMQIMKELQSDIQQERKEVKEIDNKPQTNSVMDAISILNDDPDYRIG